MKTRKNCAKKSNAFRRTDGNRWLISKVALFRLARPRTQPSGALCVSPKCMHAGGLMTALKPDTPLPDCLPLPRPGPMPAKIRFGRVRSVRSVFTSSTDHSRNSLILFNFSNHRRHHRRHRFGRWFGIEKWPPYPAENSLNFFNLRAIKTGVACAVNP